MGGQEEMRRFQKKVRWAPVTFCSVPIFDKEQGPKRGFVFFVEMQENEIEIGARAWNDPRTLTLVAVPYLAGHDCKSLSPI